MGKNPNRTRCEATCAACQKPFMAVVADRKRGGGKCCSRSCAQTLAVRAAAVVNTTDEGWLKRRQRRRKMDRTKDNAREAVARAIRAGRITRDACETCGSPDTEAHHDDYAKPLSVRWLCRKHHRELHAKQRFGVSVA